jgi:pimeloyl-ACP methyl ester carboxylesterase
VKVALENRDADVVVVDNLGFLISSGVKAAADLRVLMKTLRRWVNDTGKSLMLVAHSMSLRGRSIRPGEVVFAAGLEMADRVVALCPSTISSNYRYLKTVYPFADEGFVEGYQLGPRGFESMGVMSEEQHLFDYRGNARVVGRRIAQLPERFPEWRRFKRAVVPSKVRFLGIEDCPSVPVGDAENHPGLPATPPS